MSRTGASRSRQRGSTTPRSVSADKSSQPTPTKIIQASAPTRTIRRHRPPASTARAPALHAPANGSNTRKSA
jgi:hypothetical protein